MRLRMRKSTLLWLGLAAFCGAALFHTSQKVNDGRQQLSLLNADLRREEESLRVLQAEWSYLNNPDRLEKLARSHLALQETKGKQFVKLSNVNVAETERAAAPVDKPVEKPAEKLAAPAPAQSRSFSDLISRLGGR